MPNELPLEIVIDDDIAIIKLNRPDSLNALTQSLCDALVLGLNQTIDNNAIKVIILTGNGKAFCAGIDLKEISNAGTALDNDWRVIQAFNRCQKPIIGAINGACVTGGLELALFCDFLYASNNAKFADTHAKVGLFPAWGMSQRLPRIIGIQRAREMSLSGQFIDAQTAFEWGLVNKLLPPELLLAETIKTAKAIAANFDNAVLGIKQLINQGWENTLGSGLDNERKIAPAHNRSIDFSEMHQRLASLRSTRSQHP